MRTAPLPLRARRPSGRARAALAILLLLVSGCAAPRSIAHPAAVQALVADTPRPAPAPHGQAGTGPALGLLQDAQLSKPYRIGVGDGLRIVGDTDFLKEYGTSARGEPPATFVKPDGNIYLPELGAVPAVGLTVVELQSELRKRLTKYKANPFASVDVIEHRSQQFYVLGAVKSPGVYAVDGAKTLLASLGVAGGTTEEADLAQAYIVRESKILPVSLAEMIKRGDMSRNITLRHGDLVYVPPREAAQVYVVGEVKRPGPVPMERGRLTLAAAVAAAGGLDAESADINQVRIFRGGWGEPSAFTISAQEVYQYGESIQMHSGDRVMVAPTARATNARVAELVLPYLNTALAMTLAGFALFDR